MKITRAQLRRFIVSEARRLSESESDSFLDTINVVLENNRDDMYAELLESARRAGVGSEQIRAQSGEAARIAGSFFRDLIDQVAQQVQDNTDFD